MEEDLSLKASVQDPKELRGSAHEWMLKAWAPAFWPHRSQETDGGLSILRQQIEDPVSQDPTYLLGAYKLWRCLPLFARLRAWSSLLVSLTTGLGETCSKAIPPLPEGMLVPYLSLHFPKLPASQSPGQRLLLCCLRPNRWYPVASRLSTVHQ